MHNSQGGSPVARDGTGVGWNGSGTLTGGSLQGPMNQLLVTSCVGCHTSATSSTIVDLGDTRIPIVYNTVPPVNPLAGGNFYWVAQGSSYDAYGHNVYGIAAVDSILSDAPGRQSGTCSSNACHNSLATAPNTTQRDKNGCQGCHFLTAHHDDSKPWYRFLKGHNSDDDYVTGIEDPDWEQNPVAGHNRYQGYEGPLDNPGWSLEYTHSISGFCGGCHGTFHKSSVGPNPGIGSSSPWLRHPTDIILNDKGGEYTGYDTIGNYSTEAPVAWLDPSNPTLESAVVMCLSCHRPHGSSQPDMLRWDYGTMVASGGGSGGCFTCHTTKD